MDLLQNFYKTTLDELKDTKNDRLWFKTNTKLGKLYFDSADYNNLMKILKQLRTSCKVRYKYYVFKLMLMFTIEILFIFLFI